MPSDPQLLHWQGWFSSALYLCCGFVQFAVVSMCSPAVWFQKQGRLEGRKHCSGRQNPLKLEKSIQSWGGHPVDRVKWKTGTQMYGRGICLFSLVSKADVLFIRDEPLFPVVLLLTSYYDHTQTHKGFLYLECWGLWVSETCYGSH